MSPGRLQAYALSKPNNPALQELLQAQPIVEKPGHKIVIEPPSTVEPAANQAGPGNTVGSATGFGQGTMGGYGGTAEDATAAPEEALPDDVPLTRTQLQAKVGACVQIWVGSVFEVLHLIATFMTRCEYALMITSWPFLLGTGQWQMDPVGLQQ